MKYLLAVQIYEKLLSLLPRVVYTLLLRQEKESEIIIGESRIVHREEIQFFLLRAQRIGIDDSERRLDSREARSIALRRLDGLRLSAEAGEERSGDGKGGKGEGKSDGRDWRQFSSSRVRSHTTIDVVASFR